MKCWDESTSVLVYKPEMCGSWSLSKSKFADIVIL
jgi:hypothetical protein